MNRMSKSVMLKMRVIACLLLVASFCMAGCGGAKNAETKGTSGNAQTVQKVNVSFQPQYDAWSAYDAKKTGLDKKNGLDINMVYFDSGMPQVQALPANQWDIGSTGTVPTLMAALRYGTEVVGVSDDESLLNTVMVRANSPLLKTKGFNPKYPGVYGSPQDLKGKTILVTTVSGVHYVLSSYLKAMGLKESDVHIINMEQSQIVSAFESGKGDVCALWAPFMFTGAQKGWKELCGGGAEIGADNPMLIITPKKYADAHPEQVAKFLKMYYANMNKLKGNEASLVPAYQDFMKDWGGVDLNKEFATQDMNKHKVFTLDQQLKMLDKANGPNQVEKQLTGIINFFTDEGKFTPAEKEQLLKFDYITDKYLKLAKEQK